MKTNNNNSFQIRQKIYTREKVGLNDFELLHLIGKGSFGKVIQVKKKDTGKIYAMKILDKKLVIENNEIEHTLAERSILEKLHHPFLINLNFSFQTEDKLYFILDYINGGELFYQLQKERKFSEDRVKFYAAEILLALEYLHNNGIVYRDLKPENLLISNEGHIIITDFGLCKKGIYKNNDVTNTFCGTPEYLAPEILMRKSYGKSVDWWAFGVIVYEMLTGLPPFYSSDVQEMYKKILSEKLKFPEEMSVEAVDLISKLLIRNIDERLQEPNVIKKHPFFKKIDFDLLYQKKIAPPFVPPVRDESDISQIDPVFTQETITLENDIAGPINTEEQINFEGFTYVSENIKN